MALLPLSPPRSLVLSPTAGADSTDSTLVSLVVVLIVLTAACLLVSLLALSRASGRSRRARAASDPLPSDLAGLRELVGRLREETATALRHPTVVRYDAFGDMGGRLSWSMALLDAQGDGTVITSIHGRSDARTYAKPVTAWESDQQLSPEEESAVQQARSA